MTSRMKKMSTLLVGALALSPAACKKKPRENPPATAFDAMTAAPPEPDAAPPSADAAAPAADASAARAADAATARATVADAAMPLQPDPLGKSTLIQKPVRLKPIIPPHKNPPREGPQRPPVRRARRA